MALMFGTAGLPHILMRFFTVADAKEARKSVFCATVFIGYFYILTFIIGFGAIVLVVHEPALSLGRRTASACSAAATWRRSISRNAVGGDIILGFISRRRVRDHPGGGVRPDAGGRLRGQPRPLRERVPARPRRSSSRNCASRRSRPSCSGILAIVLGIAFEKKNIAFMVGLAFAIAASANFPVLLLSMFWRGCPPAAP